MKPRRKIPIIPPKKMSSVQQSEVRDPMSVEVNTVFRVNVKNACPYPIRVAVWVDEATGYSTCSVFKQFEKRELEINLLTFKHLQRDPKIRMSALST